MTQVSKLNVLSPKQAARRLGVLEKLLDPELFKALGDPTRAKLLACLARCGRACSVTEVAECCAVDFSVVSRHLALLMRAGLLESVKEGRTVFYRVRYTSFSVQLRLLADALDECCDTGKSNGGCCD